MARTTRTLVAAVAAVMIGAASFATPAAAGGSVSFTYIPRDAKQARALSSTLQLFAAFDGMKNGGIKQKGKNNSAGLAQNGSGNFGLVHQQGSGHKGTLTQNGNNNAYGLFQFGKKTRANVVQKGTGKVGTTVQWGW
ncbi:curlin [Bauldia sp.]|uniref:curlin n=1 Tax=Bauldia sp. TaxID=2575872 RepID=UPI0025C5FE51|nr:curlin [Bauldia sp.]